MKTHCQFRILLLSCLWLAGLAVHAQKFNLDQKPWERGAFPKVPTDQIYQFKVGYGEDFDFVKARNAAIMDFLTALPGIDSVNSVCMNQLVEIIESGKPTQGSSNFECNDQIFQNIVSLNSRLDHVDTRRADGKYQVRILFAFQDPKIHRNTLFDPVTPHYTNKYGWTAGWRSLIVPGWGQFYKRTNTKGIIFLGGFLLSSGIAIFYEGQRADNFRKSQETSNITLIREYRNLADDSALIRNISISTAGALWIWSVIDAMNTRGALRYDYSKNARLYASRDGVTLGIRF